MLSITLVEARVRTKKKQRHFSPEIDVSIQSEQEDKVKILRGEHISEIPSILCLFLETL